jgi:hypothetical protein
MLFINLQNANTDDIINCCVLKISNPMPILRLQIDELHVELHVVLRPLLLISDSGN